MSLKNMSLDINAEEVHVMMQCQEIDLPNYTITHVKDNTYTIIHTFENEPYSPAISEDMIENVNKIYETIYTKQDKLSHGTGAGHR